ncbi:MAG: C39 family peptidase [Clostridia bacterium]|nr:C39 family peptidase [Clostridia bacterium]
MSKVKKIIAAVLICIVAIGSVTTVISYALPDGTRNSRFDDWEKFYSFNKTILQRHAHPRKLMKLPIYRQGHNYTDGVACVQSLLRYANYEFDIREDNLATALKANEENGVYWQDVKDYLEAVRLNDTDDQWFEVEKREHMTVDDLVKELKKGHPVLLKIQAWNWDENGEYSMNLDYSNEWECGHWVIAVGYSGEGDSSGEYRYNKFIYFMDPSTGGNYTYIPWADLVARWHDYTVDENNLRYDMIQMGLIVNICGTDQPDGERYYDAFYGLM